MRNEYRERYEAIKVQADRGGTLVHIGATLHDAMDLLKDIMEDELVLLHEAVTAAAAIREVLLRLGK